MKPQQEQDITTTPSMEDEDAEEDDEETQAGPPDSHEAMHNRDSTYRNRSKRGFEFLLGLINNNSRYEVTRVDPELKEKKMATQSSQAGNLLLELIVKIAKHPDQWNKVHELLQNIDKGLMTSRNFVEKYSEHRPADTGTWTTNTLSTITTTTTTTAGSIPEATTGTPAPATANDTGRSEEKRERHRAGGVPFKDNRWPTFDDRRPDRAKFTGYAPKPEAKNFVYHRVTGKPAYLKKNPTAYIAVSVIQPKQIDEEDLVLENELRKLKPWGRSWNVQKKSDEGLQNQVPAL